MSRNGKIILALVVGILLVLCLCAAAAALVAASFFVINTSVTGTAWGAATGASAAVFLRS